MDKKTVFSADELFCACGNVVAKGLNLHITEGFTTIKCDYPMAILGLIYGIYLPNKGNISLYGVVLSEKTAAQRRVSVIADKKSGKTEDMLKEAINKKPEIQPFYVLVQNKLRDEAEKIASELKSVSPENAEKLKEKAKKLKVDITSTGLKNDREIMALEADVKSAKELLSNLQKTKGFESAAQKMKIKYFSACHDLYKYNGKKIPADLLNFRINSVICELSLSENSSDTEKQFACACVTVPRLIVCMGDTDICELRDLSEKHGYNTVYISSDIPNADIEIDSRIFKKI